MAADANGEALGLVEVYGLCAAFAALDAGCKAGDVRAEPFDRNKPAKAETLPVPLLVTVKFRGAVADVRAAVEAGRAAAEAVSGVVCTHIIASAEPGIQPMLAISGMDKS